MSEDRQKGGRSRKAELERLAAMQDTEIDTSDIPEVGSWTGAVVGKFYRPLKKQITLRLDADVIAWFKATGPGYQTAINKVLRGHMAGHTARTGDTCPETGIWVSMSDPRQSIPVTKGNRMPPLDGKATVWIFPVAA